MPDFTNPTVRQDLTRTKLDCFGEDECGGWWAVMDGQADVVDAPAWTKAWWAANRIANTLRVELNPVDGLVGQAFEVEVWAQPQDRAGGGVRVFHGQLTIAAGAAQGVWYLLGACTGPRSESWGVRVRKVGGPAGTPRVRFRLVGDVCASVPGVQVLGENVT